MTLLERIKLIVAQRLADARALIATYTERPPMADGTDTKDEA